MQRQKDKVEDEFAGDSKRGYLDAVSSDEDESRVDALAGERDNKDSVSRILYDDDELERLIHHMKNLTTLGGIENEDWSEETLEVMKDFIELPREIILSIYFRGNVLKAELNFPSTPVYEMTYFIRAVDQVLRYDNFPETIIFGTSNDKVEATVQTIADTLLAPIGFRMTKWPDSVKADFCDALHQYLYKINDLRFKMYSLTMLYLPREGIDMTIEEACANKEYIQRLEGIVVHWMRQMRLTINDYEHFMSQELLGLADEYDFWIYRYENLCALNYQLESPAVDRIVNILRNSDSTYFRPFTILHREINADTEEAKSNIIFLEILRDASRGLNNSYDIDEIPKHILTILHLFRFIWLNSPFYNTPARMTHLFILLNNQIILVCHRFIDPRKILMSGSTRWGMKMLERATDVCRYYKKIYLQFVNAYDTSTSRPWKFNAEEIFRDIDAFLGRCCDFYEICRASIDFARLDETVDIPIPRFGGTQGEEYEKVCMKVEKLFLEHLQLVYNNSRKMFTIQEVTWHDDMSAFRAKTKDLDIMIENLMNVALKNINNVAEALSYVYGLRMYMNRNSLVVNFNGIITSIWRSFAKECQAVKQELLGESTEYPSSCPHYSGRALNLHFKSKRLEATRLLLANADWLGYCPIGEEVYQQNNILLGSINDMIIEIHHKWMDDIDSNPQSRLDQYLIRQSVDKLGILEANLDSDVLNLCYEASVWRYLGFQVPVYVEMIMDKWPTLQFVSESVLMLILAYNKITRALSDEERSLFKPLLKTLDRELRPGLSKLTWNSEFIDTYVKGCCAHVKRLQNFLAVYKISNRAISSLCNEICLMKIIDVKPNYVYTIHEFTSDLRRNRDKVYRMIKLKYNGITQCISTVYEGLRSAIDEGTTAWKIYLMNLDKLLEEAMKFCLKESLIRMYHLLHGTTGTSPVFHIEADLIDKKINFIPSLYEVTEMIGNMTGHLLEPLQKKMPRLRDLFSPSENNVKDLHETLTQDQYFHRIQEKLNNEVSYCTQHIQQYLKSWESFADIWEVNKDMFITRYEKLNPTVASFDADIGRYTEVANNVKMQETVTTVHFLDINSDRLKAAIIKHCSLWQQKLTGLLLHMTQLAIDGLYKYITENGEKVITEPKNLTEMQATLHLLDRLKTEIHLKEEEFPKLQEQYQTLVKYEIPMTLEFKRRMHGLKIYWGQYLSLLSTAEVTIEENKESFKNKLLEEAATFTLDATGLLAKFHDNGPFDAVWRTTDALAWLDDFRCQVDQLKQTGHELNENLKIFGVLLPDSREIAKVEKDLSAIEIAWQLTKEWDDIWVHYETTNFWTLEIDEIELVANNLFRKFTKLSREFKERGWKIAEQSRVRVDKFRRTIPLMTDLKNAAMRDRHWSKVKVIVNHDFDQESEDFTLRAILEMQMYDFAEQINDISNSATMELMIEMGLKNISTSWDDRTLEMQPYKNRGIFLLRSVDEVVQSLEEHLVQLSAMKSTSFVEPFAAEVDYWEKSLSTVGEVIDTVLLVQKQFTYLDNIFNSEDIRKQLPKETDDFDKSTATWRTITSRMAHARGVLDACLKPDNLLEILRTSSLKLESIEHALERYLETKRYAFPRFYFISNEDLLEILANSRHPDLIQPHIKKLFDNIKCLQLSKSGPGRYLAEGMLSTESEYVEFLEPVILEGQVECWLCQVETRMRDCLRHVLRHCRVALRKILGKRDKWVKEWPSQPGITSTQIQWTSDCTKALLRSKLMDSKKPLRKLKNKQNQILVLYSDALRRNLDRLQRIKFKAIVVIEIHARDVIEKMYKNGCKDVSAFEWLSQLRFYWDRDIDDCVVRQTNTHFRYGYEYLGNTERLVITPLTDRCYITLTTALHLYRGGSPKGPAGTGKTETVKDLGKALGFNVIVQNCSEGLDYKSMGRLFSGLAQTGAWGCFDEFNRINVEVLSVVAQQILSILSALSQKLSQFIFEGANIGLKSTCGIFITMNPGYAGRTELPDNLKSMFRPISMMRPDSSMIAEINLFGEGFRNTRILAKKEIFVMCAGLSNGLQFFHSIIKSVRALKDALPEYGIFSLYTLAQQQLSQQPHYDFGLRGIVTLTRYAGKKRRQHVNLLDEEVIILAMKDMNAAKLTADDVPLFTGITSDLFPTTTVPTIDYSNMLEYITKEAITANLQPIPVLLRKVIELYETQNSRHSTMIVGESNTGKSVTWKTLRNTMTAMKKDGRAGFKAVDVYPINPKALNLGELYGEYNLKTGEWFDGVISSIMRKTCSDDSPNDKWILFDGPIDAVWIENMNSVMDDNKILTLINNERITMPSQVSLLFEVQNLAVASPATVSRAGMVYNDYKDLGWRPLVNSWLENYKKTPEFVEEMGKLFQHFVDEILTFKREKCSETIAIPELNAVESLCKLLKILATSENGVELGANRDEFNLMCKNWFLFCAIWSLCGSVDEVGRQRIDNYIREMEGVFPLKDTVYEYYVDVRQRSFVSWEEKLPLGWRYQSEMPFFKITVPTVDTIRYEYLVKNLLEKDYPVVLIGPVGAGKTSVAQSVIDSFDKTKYCCLTINMSSQTSSNHVQEAIESRLEKRTRQTYIPTAGKNMIAFMDDFNMPMKDTYGSQAPLELIRQFIDYQFWYDRQKQTRKYIQKTQLMAAMGPPGGGRNTITDRLLTKFNIINITFPIEKQILRIYGTLLNQQLFDFHPEVKGIANEIALSTLEIYKSITRTMLPTPMKIHYLFNLRDISKVFQGLLRSHKDYQYSRPTFLRLWIHEIFRVFSDRFIDERDRDWFIAQINEQLGKYFELTFHNLCPEKRSPIFGDFMNPWNVYEDLSDIGALRRFIGMQMDEYNTLTGVVRLDLILFIDAIEHICRIVRVISQPNGNMLLVGIGGSGRQSLSRLASYICELSSFQIEVTRRYGVAEFREDLKRLYSTVGVDNTPTCFLFNDTQVTVEHFLEIINNMLGTGEVANLYKSDEMEDIRNRLAKEASKAGISSNVESIYHFLINRVRVNLRMILCMSPVGDNFRNRLRQYPSLINCMTIDWFLPWPKDALLEIGNKFLMNLSLITTIGGQDKVEPRRSETAIPILPLQERMRYAVSSTFALIHDSVVQYSVKMLTEMKRHNYVTPSNFLELVGRYKKMLMSKRQRLAEQSDKLGGGLFKIDDTRVKVNEMAKELEVMQEQVLRSTKDCEEFLITIVNQKRDADEAQKSITTRSLRITEESKVCRRLEEIARADLADVEPALEEAMKALDTLNKKDLAEIKSFARPPPKVEIVLEAVMVLKNAEPTWSESKKQLGDVNFLLSLRNFDKDHISDRTLKTIGKYTSNPEFDPEKVGQVSIAAKSLAMWVIAMENYGKLFRIIAPKREKLASALESLHEKERILADAISQLEKLQSELKRLQKNYDEKMKEKRDLIRLAEDLELKLKRAAMLVDGLSGERLRWQKTLEILAELYERLPGDCLISSGCVSYLGPFVSIYREELIKLWLDEVMTMEIPLSVNLDITEFLSDSTTIREWNIQGLPSDNFSTENGIIITHAIRWPLVIDPQCQAVKWIKNMESENGLEVIDFGSHDFVRTLERSLQLGKPVLLENVGESLDPVLNPILHRTLVKLGDSYVMKFNDKMISYSDQFRFFITTKLPNPHYSPEISTKTTLCNFAIKEQGLEAQLLGIVVRREKPQLEEQKDNLVLTIAKGKRTLRELEDKILQLLTVASGPLLEDLDLLNTLQSAKVTSVSVEESLITSEKTEQEIDKARGEYRTCSQRAATLFFVLNDMSHVDPMYQFSLDSYIVLFKISIDKSPRRVQISERIDILNDYHTYAVYKNTCQGLFEKDKLLFSFNMCLKILEARGEMIPQEYDFLLKGGIALERENQPDKHVDWLTRETWDNLTELDKLSGFHGVAASFEQFSRDWYNWYINTEPETKTLPGEWEANLNEFQKMLIIRSCRFDRMTFCITSFIIHNLGQRFVEPPVLDIKAAFKDSIAQTPLIFVLSSGVDPSSALLQLAEAQGMSHKFMTLSLGQGQSPIARGLIQKGAQEGAWVFLANCHLSLSWMPELDKIIEGLANRKDLHPEFRLWLSSSPSPQFPISILQASVKMTTEPPKGLKANMKRLYGLITEDQFNVCKATRKYKKLLFTLVFFHSILLERRKFQQLGWNIIYSFNDSDFEVSENLLEIYLDEYPETPWESLKYLIAGVCYGGHVTDDWDRRLLMTYVQHYFTEDILSQSNYRLSTLASYYVPRDGSLQSYHDFIGVLPSTDKPEAFGQHINADISSSIIETQTVFNTLMSLQMQIATSEMSSKEDTVLQMVIDMRAKLPQQINYGAAERLMGARKTPLDVVLLQEITRYNGLLVRTRCSLSDLERAIKGLVLMSEDLEEIFTYVHDGRVPPAWLTTYPSLKPLGSWTRDLVSRIEHFAKWAETTHPPLLFWLAAYTFPTGFLTAVLQTSARLWNISIDSFSWSFAVLDENSIVDTPADGVFIRSIFLEGAGWDRKRGTLVDPAPMQLIYEMPVIHFCPTEQVKKKSKGLYNCPCYYYPMRGGTNNRSAFVVAVDLECGNQSADFWVKRGTALLLSLAT